MPKFRITAYANVRVPLTLDVESYSAEVIDESEFIKEQLADLAPSVLAYGMRGVEVHPSDIEIDDITKTN